MTLCSVLIPSRARPRRLLSAIRSVRETSDRSRVQILVRVDEDDASSIAVRPAIEAEARLVVGPRRRGYASHHEFYEELAGIATGTWVFVMNDDATIEQDGTPWDRQLEDVEPTQVVQPETYQLGGSRYRHGCYTFPIVPNGAWRAVGHPRLGYPVDAWLDQVLRVDAGWPVHHLAGVTLNHQRDDDATLEVHRRIS